MEAFDCDVPKPDCLICNRHLQEAKIMPCHHIFCKMCIETMVKAHDSTTCDFCMNYGDMVLCHMNCPHPDCGQNILFHDFNNVELLPSHSIVNDVMRLMIDDVDEDFDDAVIKELEKEDDEQAMEDYRKWVAEGAASAGSGNPFELLPGKNFMAEKLPLLNCEEHPEQEASSYCDTCCQTCCTNCSLNQHRNHFVSIIEYIIGYTNILLKNYLEEAPDHIELVNDRIELTLRLKRMSVENTYAISDEITASFDELKKCVDERLAGVLEQVKRVQEIRMMSFQKRLTYLEDFSNDMTKTVMDIEDALERKYGPDLLKIRSSVLKQTKEIQKLKYTPFPKKDDSFVFTASEERVLLSINSFGMLRTCGYGPSSIAIGHGLRRASVGLEAHFTVHVCDHLGNPMREGGDLVEVLILNGHGVRVHARVLDCDDGSYRVIYIPDQESRHSIGITVSGMEVPSCPFEFDVHKVREYNDVGNVVFAFGGPGSEPGQLCRPWGIDTDCNGRIVVSDRSNDRIQIFDDVGGFIRSFGGSGHLPGKLFRPAGVAIDNRTDGESRIVVADKDNHRIQIFNFQGEIMNIFGDKGSNLGQFHYPWDVAVNQENHRIAVTDSRNFRVQLFTEDGNPLAFFGPDNGFSRHLDCPRGVTFDINGHIIVTDFNNHRLLVLDQCMHFNKFIGCPGHGSENFLRPQGVAVDREGNILIADSKNQRIVILRPTGEVLRIFGSSDVLMKSMGLCTSPAGLIHVVEFESCKVIVF